MDQDDLFNKSLFEVCQAMVAAVDLRRVLDTILDLSMRALGADAGSILLYEDDSERLRMLAAKGLPPGVIERGYVPREGSVTDRVLESDEPVVMDGLAEADGATLTPASRIRSALCVPLRFKGQTIGTMNLNRYRWRGESYSEREKRTVMILASQAAICIENARLHEQNVAQARLAAVGETVAGISHCIKNLLTGLRGGVGLMDVARRAQDWPASERAADLLRTNVERVSLLVMDMLDYAKTGKQPIRDEFDVAYLFEQVREVTALKAEKKQVAVQSEIETGMERVRADQNQIFRCLLNLLENAIDSIDGGGRVVVRCEAVSAERARQALGEEADLEALGRIACLTVADNGAGVEPEDLSRIFEPFYSTKRSRGTGLGLAVTRKIVEEHGGRVLVDSEPGKGSSFHLIFPERCADEEAADAISSCPGAG